MNGTGHEAPDATHEAPSMATKYQELTTNHQ
jgi:hypothetical protein